MKNEPESMMHRIANSYVGRVFLAAGMAAAIYSCRKVCPGPEVVEKEVEKIVEKCPEPPKVVINEIEDDKDKYMPDGILKIKANISSSDKNLKLENVVYNICNPFNECMSRLVDVVKLQESSTAEKKLQSGSTIDSKVQAGETHIQNGSTAIQKEDKSLNVTASIPLSAIKRKGDCKDDYGNYFGQSYRLTFDAKGFAPSVEHILFIEGGENYSSSDFYTYSNKQLMSRSDWAQGSPERAMAWGPQSIVFSWAGNCAYSGYDFGKGNYKLIIKASADVPEESKKKAPMTVRFQNGCDGDGFVLGSKKVPREGEEESFDIKIKSPHYDWFSIAYPYDDWDVDLVVDSAMMKNDDFCE